MKKDLKKLLSLLLILVLCISAFTACGAKNDDQSTNGNTVTEDVAEDVTQEPEPTEVEEVVEEEPAMDLGGMEIILGDWWSPAEAAEPTNAQEEATLEYRQMIQEKYNFTMKQVAVSDYGGMQELFTTSTMAEDPAAHVFLLAPEWTSQPLANGLLYDLSTLDSFDFTESKWISNVTEKMTFGESVYGMNAGKAEPKLGVYWNKRLFKEAGLDPELPYELQASGEWTWEKFEELCKTLTIDSNNDGTIDNYALASFSVDFFRGAVTSNNAKFIGKDDSGKFTNATLEPNFLEAMQWAVSLIEKGYEMPVPADANWDWFIAAFHDAKVAMTYGEQYKVGTWSDMADDWGFVLCPKGPKSEGYSVYFGDNIAVIPSSYDKETAEKIAFAYNLWTEPTPGYEDEDSWKEAYYTRFRDERAVDETLSMMYDGAIENNDYLPLVYGTSYGDFAWAIYGLEKTPAEKIEEVQGMWQSLLDDANK
jgi:ABC-type glycerol-3-phosphate transport system substrate-binding protein